MIACNYVFTVGFNGVDHIIARRNYIVSCAPKTGGRVRIVGHVVGNHHSARLEVRVSRNHGVTSAHFGIEHEEGTIPVAARQRRVGTGNRFVQTVVVGERQFGTLRHHRIFGQEFLARRGYNIVEDRSELMEEFTYADAIKLCNKLLASYEKGEVGEIYIAYTNFKNTVSHIPTLLKLLPILETDDDSMDEGKNDDLIMNFEPDDEEALKLIIPKYVASLLHGALIEATAAENGARMQAMDSATNNAEEMIDKLTLKYNRARQGSITQELTEIIAGAEAIS